MLACVLTVRRATPAAGGSWLIMVAGNGAARAGRIAGAWRSSGAPRSWPLPARTSIRMRRRSGAFTPRPSSPATSAVPIPILLTTTTRMHVDARADLTTVMVEMFTAGSTPPLAAATPRLGEIDGLLCEVRCFTRCRSLRSLHTGISVPMTCIEPV